MRRSSSISKENHVFIEKEVVMFEEELDGIDIDAIGNLVDLPRLIMFLDKECKNLKVVTDGEELVRNNDRKNSSEV